MTLVRGAAGLFALTLLVPAAAAATPAAPARRAAAEARASGLQALLAAGLQARAEGRDAGEIVAMVRDRAASEPALADEAAAALLLLDRNDDALDVLLAAGRNAEAFSLLAEGWRVSEALALPLDEASPSGRLLRAGLLVTAGRRDEAVALLDGGEAGDAARAVREAAALGLRGEALARALGAVAGRPAAAAREMLPALWPARRAEAEAAWTWLARQVPPPPADEILVRIAGILDAAGESADARQIVGEGAALLDGLSACQQAQAGAGLVGIAELRNDREAALRLAQQWAALSGSPAAWFATGDLLAERERWDEAADAYGRAAGLQPGEGAARWMQGVVLARAGREAESVEASVRATAAPADACAQLRLAAAMELTGAADRAARVRASLLESPQATESVVATAASRLARVAARAGEPAGVERAFDAARARMAAGRLDLGRVMSFVQDAQAAELARAVAAGDALRALRLAEHALEPFLRDLDATADVVAMLRAGGREDEAESLLARVSDRVTRAADENPASARFLNARAWLAARTGADLGAGLRAAERAAELAPESAGILDTLAEVRFQLGDRAGALEAGRRALALQPDREYFAEQLARFETGDRSTRPPVE